MTPLAPILLPDRFNAAEHFVDRRIAEGRGDKVAIECGNQRVTYRQLFELVNQVGDGLRKLGVRREERVLLLLLDTPEFAASFFGAIKRLLPRNRRKQTGMYQRLELLVVSLEVHLQF
jgi:acyl-coenzyme A synthetase/AMP-(fatty) acid ligase